MSNNANIAARNARWFRIAVYLGILWNALLFVPALFATEALMAYLALDPDLSPWTPRFVGLILLLLTAYYAWGGREPIVERKASDWVVYLRCLQVLLWLTIAWCVGAWSPWCWLFFIDAGFTSVQWYFLMRAQSNASIAAERPWRRPLSSRLWSTTFRCINYFVAWHRLPTFLGTLNLGAIREDLRDHNLLDTPEPPPEKQPPWDPDYKENRSPDGSYNDLSEPTMGQTGTRFGRNMPLDKVFPDPLPAMLKPNPRLISDKLLARDTFKPATTLNLLAAAWIQFQNHGWFSHKKFSLVKTKTMDIDPDPMVVPRPAGSDWPDPELKVPHTVPDPTRPAGAPYPPTHLSTETHWWAASQIYGSTLELQKKLRTFSQGKLLVEPDTGLLPLDPEIEKGGVELTGFNDNWWMGQSLIHNLFVREHNRVCDELARVYPDKKNDDQWLFQKSRLIVAAISAKIHTIEWTPGILGHPALNLAMQANWSGLLGESIFRNYGRFADNDGISGIRGSETNHQAAGYSLTEDFVAVYRLHPLIPDDFVYLKLDDRKFHKSVSFTDIQGAATRESMVGDPSIKLEDLFYSFGRAHPGAITLRNFPNTLRRFMRLDGTVIDLATIDILRDRERGIPKYNEFRRNLRMPAPATFEEMTGRSADDELVQTMKSVYEGDIERVDLMVGMFAEPLPRGFGFSDTAFRIFVLMASRRLKSDRFFTVDYRPEIYTQFGLDWIADTTMKTLLLRHFPELGRSLEGVENAFAPWKEV